MPATRAARTTAVLLSLAVLLPASPGAAALEREPAGAAEGVDWRANVRRAKGWADARRGTVRFAVVNEGGRLFGVRRRTPVPMASVLKVMLMVAYLRHGSVRNRDLRPADRDLLRPMIVRSDNVTATRILHLVGRGGMERLAARAGMRHFSLVMSPWGLSETSARDQARFMERLEDFIPDRHERYARRLLRSIVPSQRWGIPEAAPEGWEVYFKGGWGSGTGWVAHQVALLEAGDRRVALAVLTRNSPSHLYGTRTIVGVARRLLRGL